MRTRAGPILAVPHPIELNDAQVIIHRRQDASDFCDMIVDRFDEMIEQSERQWTRPRDVAEFCYRLDPGVIP